MLQFGRILDCSILRRTPRHIWWKTARNLLHASTAKTVTATSTSSPKQEITENNLIVENKIKNVVEKDKQINKRVQFTNKTLLKATFKSLSLASEEESESTKKLNEKIKTAQTIKEILIMSDDPEFNKQNAATIILTLYNWISDGKIKLNDLQTQGRFWKILNKLEINSKPTPMKEKSDPLRHDLNDQIDHIKKLNTFELIEQLTQLASKQQRISPLLDEITNNLTKSNNNLNIKLLADILYSVSVLTYYNNDLMDKISKDLLKVIPKNNKSSVIGSILKSIGLLRHRNESLLNSLSEWVESHKDTVRPQEIRGLLMSLAYLGYIPKNIGTLMQNVIEPLKESDMCNSTEFLDVVWASNILGLATPEQYESVLNSGFLSRLFDMSDHSIPNLFKILNINAGARLLPNYKGSLLPDEFPLFNTQVPCSKEKTELSKSVISALKILAPSNCINININTKMGFFLDAEICVDKNCSPISFTQKSNETMHRIAVMTCCYHDYCRGVIELMGTVKFYKKLLHEQGYKVLIIPYSDVNSKDKLIQRVQYIIENIKKLVSQ